ncbi:TRAP transporter small permease subunit [Phaeobacter sp. C3_T13_0]|uniref:TRAP transporter small permease subunit n=1 Tax=Phaeobacter cretensis TaxID=3342641 RepID=UPI0039BD7DFC
MLKLIERMARALAIVGGLVLTLLVVLTCVSVIGRGLNTLGHSDALAAISESAASALISSGVGPVTGDFELVEAGVAFAIFAFLPICQLYGSHATVDIFTSALGRTANTFISAFWEIILTGVIILITVRLFVGMQSKLAYGETTFLLQFPVWWAFAASFLAAALASIIGVYCAIARMAEVVTGRRYMPIAGGAVH